MVMESIKQLRYQPCCGYFLQGGVRAIGILDFGLAMLGQAMVSSTLVSTFPLFVKDFEKNRTDFNVRLAFIVSHAGLNIIYASLGILLFKAAKQRSSIMCKIWMMLSTVQTLCSTSHPFVKHIFITTPTTTLAGAAIFPVYRIYCMYVVASFIREINTYGGFNAALSGLSDAEVEEFEIGHPPDLTEKNEELETVQVHGFNKDFQIQMEDLEFDEVDILGSGAFGTVYKARLVTNNPPLVVAVKTSNPLADGSYFKALLGELKIMTSLSTHEHVVNLIGACTSNIREKKLYIVVEFCPYGNLHQFLKSRRAIFVSFVKDGLLVNKSRIKEYENLKATTFITTLHLMKWALEIALGMQFLSENKIIHGDLAARNVLLSVDKTVKITDFGLSRKLYQRSVSDYIKKQEQLLPWRWMAIESLTDKCFSTKTDVWSFGVTIWELFSLSEIPFPGNSWNDEFITRLNEGFRMRQPVNATNELYNLMLECWKPNPEDRPTFDKIKLSLEDIITEVLSYQANLDKASLAVISYSV